MTKLNKLCKELNQQGASNLIENLFAGSAVCEWIEGKPVFNGVELILTRESTEALKYYLADQGI